LNQIKRLPTDWKALQEERQNVSERWLAIFGEAQKPEP
jgi:hypothetical protein